MQEIIYLYHIRRDMDSGDFSKGYIGVSKNSEQRYYHHKIKPNVCLKEAFSQYNDINMEVICAGLMIDMLQMEKKLRPCNHIGWNILKGGGIPPKPKYGYKKKAVNEWYTPKGVFRTAKEAGDVYGVTEQSLARWCKREDRPDFYKVEILKNTESTSRRRTACVINNTEYHSLVKASEILAVSRKTIWFRINNTNPKWNNYQYKQVG